MKVKTLKKLIEDLDDESDIFIALRKGYRPYGMLKEIKTIEPTYEQDTNKPSYVIDVDIEDNSMG